MRRDVCEAEPSNECEQGWVCENGGLCIQQWNTFTCQCDMTSFTGPTCGQGKI